MLRYQGISILNKATIEAVLSSPSFSRVRILYVPWLIPSWAKAQAWWNVILVKKGVDLSERLLAHELAHVFQWRTLGFLAFIFQYVRFLILHGYDAHPMEVDARSAETNDYYLQWAKEILDAKKEPGQPAGPA